MGIIIVFVLLTAIIALIAADCTRKIDMTRIIPMGTYILIAPNIILLTYILYTAEIPNLDGISKIISIILVETLFFYMWLRLNVFPVLDGKKASIRLKIMAGGRVIIYYGLLAFITQCIIFTVVYPYYHNYGMPSSIFLASIIYAVCIVFIILANGVLRIYFTSKRLAIKRRIIMLLTAYIPIVNLFVLLYACRLIDEEYKFECEKVLLRELRVDSDLCKTKYPLVMVHGIGFRDLRYFNYWGRIPRELMRNNATVHYGNQEALGTIEYNAKDIQKRILQVMEETGAEKVNIIAHSKGGLDARYTISELGMDKYVASLTTINTPHWGCKFVDKACKLPDRFYRFVARRFDKTFRKLGDKNPDFYTATRQFATFDSKRFNETVKDSNNVYYQSYMTKMKSRFSDPLLFIPYSIIKAVEGENDGLVSLESAKWGEFKGIITNKYRRGISHGDIIDLKREDYKDFDVLEFYVKLVSDLSQKGF